MMLPLSLILCSIFITVYILLNLQELPNQFPQDFIEKYPVYSEANSDAHYASNDNLGDLSYFNSALNNFNFYGQWTMRHGVDPPNFQNQNGFTYLTNYKNFLEFAPGSELYLHLYDGEYTDSYFSIASFGNFNSFIKFNSSYNIINGTLQINSIPVTYRHGYLNHEDMHQTCDTKMKIFFTNSSNNNSFIPPLDHSKSIDELQIQIFAESAECNFSFITSQLSFKERRFLSEITYFLICTIIAFGLGVYCCCCLEEIIENVPNSATNISSFTMLLLIIFDIYILINTVLAILYRSYWYTLIMIPYLVLPFYYEPLIFFETFNKLALGLSRRRANFLRLFSILSIITLLGLVVSSLIIIRPIWIYFAFSLSFVPQIIQNYLMKKPYKWNLYIIAGLCLPKLAYMGYIGINQRNLMRNTPFPSTITIILGTLILIQVLLLIIQTWKPTFWLKNYNGFKLTSLKTEKIMNEVCSICLRRFGSPPNSFNQSESDLSQQPPVHDRHILTPCKHQFHLNCLQDWIQNRTDCPYCRTNLPALPEEY